MGDRSVSNYFQSILAFMTESLPKRLKIEPDPKKAGTISVEFKYGQKKETPSPGAATRVFYESLYKQRPTSLMALKWCLEYGVLPRDKCQAKVAEFEKLLTTSKSNKLIKSESKNKRKAVRESHAPDMDLMGTGGQETIGAMVVG